MIDKASITQELTDWLKNFVEIPNPALGNWSLCPYARQARVKNQIEIVVSDDLQNAVYQSLSLLADKEVVVVCFDHNQITPVQLEQFVTATNKDIMPNYVILEDHPDVPEILNGVAMNFGKCGLLIVSELKKLNAAADQLKDKGYYDHWPKENFDNVVAWRYK